MCTKTTYIPSSGLDGLVNPAGHKPLGAPPVQIDTDELLDMMPLMLVNTVPSPASKVVPNIDDLNRVLDDCSESIFNAIEVIDEERKPTRAMKKVCIDTLLAVVKDCLESIEQIGDPDWRNPANMSAANACDIIKMGASDMRDRLMGMVESGSDRDDGTLDEGVDEGAVETP